MDEYKFTKDEEKKFKKVTITITIIISIAIITIIGFGINIIYKEFHKYKQEIKNTNKIADEEITSAPNLKKIELKGEYNSNVYAAIVMKGTSQVQKVVSNELKMINFGGKNDANSEFENKLINAITMKLIQNFENYINDGNFKLDIPAIEKAIGVDNENDIFVSAKIVDNKEPNLPNQNYYIDPKVAMFKDIKIPNYSGGYLEIVFLNKKNVSNYLNRANENKGSEQYKVVNNNIDGFDILLAYMWMNNGYTPLYYTDTPLYSGNTGWTTINKYKNSNYNEEDNESDEGENNNENINNNNNNSSGSNSSIEDEAEGTNNQSGNSNVENEDENTSNNSSSIEDDEESSTSNSSISESESSSSSSSSADDDSVSCGDDD